MNISQIQQLDVGMKGITCSGRVTWAGEPKNIVGTNEQTGNDYDFWSQFFVIKDAVGKIGVSVIIEPDNNGEIKKGDMVTIEKAELKEYYKDNKPVLKLQGQLGTIAPNQSASQQPPQAPQNAPQSTKAPRNGRDISIERQAAFKAACDAWDTAKPEDIIKLAIAGHYFIETGNDFYVIPTADESITEQSSEQNEYVPNQDDIPF